MKQCIGFLQLPIWNTGVREGSALRIMSRRRGSGKLKRRVCETVEQETSGSFYDCSFCCGPWTAIARLRSSD